MGAYNFTVVMHCFRVLVDLLHSDYYALLSVEFGLCKIRNLRISLYCDHSFANGFKLKCGQETSALGQTFICIIAFCHFF